MSERPRRPVSPPASDPARAAHQLPPEAPTATQQSPVNTTLKSAANPVDKSAANPFHKSKAKGESARKGVIQFGLQS